LLCKSWEQSTDRSLLGMLRKYAGYGEKQTEVKDFWRKDYEEAGNDMTAGWQLNRQRIINRWLAWRAKLRKLPLQRKPEILGHPDDEALQVIRQAIHALNLARGFCNLCYDAFEEDASAPLAPPQCMDGLLVKVFPNVTVKANPKTRSRWGKDRPQV